MRCRLDGTDSSSAVCGEYCQYTSDRHSITKNDRPKNQLSRGNLLHLVGTYSSGHRCRRRPRYKKSEKHRRRLRCTTLFVLLLVLVLVLVLEAIQYSNPFHWSASSREPPRSTIGKAAVQTAIEYEYRFTEYRPPRRTEYEYDEIRCEARTKRSPRPPVGSSDRGAQLHQLAGGSVVKWG